jgi:Protein of unknown function (DUF1194)
MKPGGAILSLLVASAFFDAPVAHAELAAVDLALVIAVDVSRSMDTEEFRLQRNGYVEAIRDPDFIAAAISGGERRIALTYVEWSGPLSQRIVVPWKLIDGAEAAEKFAAALEAEPPAIGRGTSISGAIEFAAVLLEANGYEAARRVIDISGDGPNNYGPPVAAARDLAVARGIVINGLPILIRPSPIVPDIARYYSDCVIGGPGSFVLPVRRVEEFAEAIRRKLILEVAGAPAANIFAVAAPSDCLIGEKARERYSDQYYPGLDR